MRILYQQLVWKIYYEEILQCPRQYKKYQILVK